MASFFTVNIAVHFLFNWKPGKTRSQWQKPSETSSTDDKRLSGILRRMSFLGRNSFLVSTLQTQLLTADGRKPSRSVSLKYLPQSQPSPKPSITIKNAIEIKRVRSLKVVVVASATKESDENTEPKV